MATFFQDIFGYQSRLNAFIEKTKGYETTDSDIADWLKGKDHTSGWCLCNVADSGGEIVMNYGLYRKKIFREIGMYNPEYQYYYADGDMAYRAYAFGYKVKDLRHIRVCSLPAGKIAIPYQSDKDAYEKNLSLYKQKILPDSLQYL